jgi:hypothetical protein
LGHAGILAEDFSMLPQLTSLQYFVLHLLFVGPQNTKQLRHALRAFGVRQSTQAFHGAMMRLAMANYIEVRQHGSERSGRTIYSHRFELTDLGQNVWLKAWRFFQSLAPPSPDFSPTPTDEGQRIAYDRKTRKTAVKKERRKDAEELARAWRYAASKMLESDP